MDTAALRAECKVSPQRCLASATQRGLWAAQGAWAPRHPATPHRPVRGGGSGVSASIRRAHWTCRRSERALGVLLCSACR